MIRMVENGKFGNLFDCSYKITKSLPHITPTATTAKSKELLTDLRMRIDPQVLYILTVRSVVEKLLAYNG